MTETSPTLENPPSLFGETGLMHPNRIGFAGLTAQGVGFAVESIIGTGDMAALGGLAVGGIADVADGKVARRWPHKLKTLEGARLDPLLDKVKTYMTALYVVAQSTNPQVALSYLANFGVDYYSTAQRGSVSEQFTEAWRAITDPSSCTVDNEVVSSSRANWAGKAKTTLQNLSGIALVGENLFREKVLPYAGLEIDSAVYQQANAGALAVAAVLGGVGIYQKAKVKADT